MCELLIDTEHERVVAAIAYILTYPSLLSTVINVDIIMLLFRNPRRTKTRVRFTNCIARELLLEGIHERNSHPKTLQLMTSTRDLNVKTEKS